MIFAPEFYALCTAYWNVYQPIIFIWLVIILAFALLMAVGFFVFYAMKPLFNKWS